MIQEQYVSFEIAKLLKEKGFPQDPQICNTAYTPSGKMSNNVKSFAHYKEISSWGINPTVYSLAPTQGLAMKWLREEKHIYIQVMLDSWSRGGHLGYYVVIQGLV